MKGTLTILHNNIRKADISIYEENEDDNCFIHCSVILDPTCCGNIIFGNLEIGDVEDSMQLFKKLFNFDEITKNKEICEDVTKNLSDIVTPNILRRYSFTNCNLIDILNRIKYLRSNILITMSDDDLIDLLEEVGFKPIGEFNNKNTGNDVTILQLQIDHDYIDDN